MMLSVGGGVVDVSENANLSGVRDGDLRGGRAR